MKKGFSIYDEENVHRQNLNRWKTEHMNRALKPVISHEKVKTSKRKKKW